MTLDTLATPDLGLLHLTLGMEQMRAPSIPHLRTVACKCLQSSHQSHLSMNQVLAELCVIARILLWTSWIPRICSALGYQRAAWFVRCAALAQETCCTVWPRWIGVGKVGEACENVVRTSKLSNAASGNVFEASGHLRVCLPRFSDFRMQAPRIGA